MLLAIDSTTTFLLDVGIFAVFALIFSIIFAKARVSIVSAQIIAGMLAGPNLLGLVKDTSVINELAAVGVVLLLFIIGLELDPVELRKMAGKVTVITFIEVSLSWVAGFASAYFILQASMLQSVIFAMVTSITSTAIVGKVYLERRSGGGSASTLIGIMIVEDILAVAYLIILSSIISGGPGAASRPFLQIAVTAVGGFALVMAAYLVANYLAPRIIDFVGTFEEEYEEIPFLFALGLGFFFAVLAALLGYSPATGAFIIGLSIRGKRSRFLESKIATINDLFIVLFFISMGSLVDPIPSIMMGLPLVAVLLLVMSAKFFGGFLSAGILFKSINNRERYLFGSWLIPRGEFSFIIGQLVLSAGVIDSGLFSLIGMVVLVSALVGPLMQRFVEPKRAPEAFPWKPKTDDYT